MKKQFITLILILSLTLITTGCNINNNTSTKTTNKNNDKIIEKKESNPKQMTDNEIIDELNNINNDITDLWNNVFCEVKWYAEEGTSSTGDTLDIDFVVTNMDKYYNKIKNDKNFIDKLNDDYSDIKSAYLKMFDKATVIYNNIKAETPKANTELSYNSEIELFNQYQSYLWKTITELES